MSRKKKREWNKRVNKEASRRGEERNAGSPSKAVASKKTHTMAVRDIFVMKGSQTYATRFSLSLSLSLFLWVVSTGRHLVRLPGCLLLVARSNIGNCVSTRSRARSPLRRATVPCAGHMYKHKPSMPRWWGRFLRNVFAIDPYLLFVPCTRPRRFCPQREFRGGLHRYTLRRSSLSAGRMSSKCPLPLVLSVLPLEGACSREKVARTGIPRRGSIAGEGRGREKKPYVSWRSVSPCA